MYATRSGLVLGFHGCDESVVKKIISEKEGLEKSKNAYDWLGTGIYFWENDPQRAKAYAHDLKKSPPPNHRSIVKHPAVIGAVINLGHCLDLLDYKNLKLVKLAYEILNELYSVSGEPLPINRTPNCKIDSLIRELDCRVINMVHIMQRDRKQPPFDSVRAAFWEGKQLYEGAGFREKNHIQICIINPNCIKGYFLPRKSNSSYAKI